MSVESMPLLFALPLAVAGGLLSFLSPCVLPLVPGYLGFLTGTTVASDRAPRRRDLVGHALAFVLGFAVLFTVAGIALGAFIGSLQTALDYVRWIGGVAVITIGLHTLGILHISILDRQRRLTSAERLPRGRLLSSFLLGVAFAAGWTPCVGAILSGIFALAATQGALAGLLFFSYALGLGLPFILLALAYGRLTGVLRRLNAHARVVSITSGLFLLAIGLLLVTDGFTRLAALAPPIEPPFVS